MSEMIDRAVAVGCGSVGTTVPEGATGAVSEAGGAEGNGESVGIGAGVADSSGEAGTDEPSVGSTVDVGVAVGAGDSDAETGGSVVSAGIDSVAGTPTDGAPGLSPLPDDGAEVSTGVAGGAVSGGTVAVGGAAVAVAAAGAWVGTATTMMLPPPFRLVEDGTTTRCLWSVERITVCSVLFTMGKLRGDDAAIGAQSGLALAGQTWSTLAKFSL